MATLTDEAFGALKDAVHQIDVRAKRLLEWRGLGFRLQHAEARFDVYQAILKGVNGVPSADQGNQLGSAWADCATNLIELSFLPDSFEAITLTKDGQPDPMIKGWIDELVATGKMVGDDVANQAFGPPSKQHVAEYKATFTKLNILRNAKVEAEISQLSSMTNALKQKFQL